MAIMNTSNASATNFKEAKAPTRRTVVHVATKRNQQLSVDALISHAASSLITMIG